MVRYIGVRLRLRNFFGDAEMRNLVVLKARGLILMNLIRESLYEKHALALWNSRAVSEFIYKQRGLKTPRL